MPDVFLFSSQRELKETAAMRDACSRACKDRGWNFQSRIVQPARRPSGRPVLPIQVRDASNLYSRAHRTRVAALVLGTDPEVPLHPVLADAVRFKHLTTLRQFIDYKACWIRLPNDATNLTWVGVFDSWCSRVECDDEHDPRCLPFHVFTGDGAGLEVSEGRKNFNSVFGAGARRTDENGFQWNLQPRDFHGTDQVEIAGYRCRAGFHWDVVKENFWRVSTPEGVWEGTGHVNIYPDAHIRFTGNKTKRLTL